jgi:glycosyltransferase involved in cell wall biosynthesis
MRIGIIYLGRRGSGGIISLNIATHLAEKADVFAVISTSSQNLKAWQDSGLEIYVFPTYRNAFEAAWAWVDRRGVRRIASQIRSYKPDVLLFPMFYTWNPLIQISLREIPTIVAIHDPIPHPGLAAWVYREIENISIRHAKRCLIFSQVFIPALQRRGARPNRIDVIPLGDHAYSSAMAEVSDFSTKKVQGVPILLFFGRITKYKGLDILLKACYQLSSSVDFKLCVVGEGDLRPYRDLLESLPNIEVVNRWVGEDEVAPIFTQADIVILPYTDASQSGVISVAASLGLPVIATRVGGIPEQIQDGLTGLLVEPNSVEQLVGAIRSLLENPEKRMGLGENLKKEFQEKRNWTIITDQILESCKRVIAEEKS